MVIRNDLWLLVLDYILYRVMVVQGLYMGLWLWNIIIMIMVVFRIYIQNITEIQKELEREQKGSEEFRS